MATLRIVLGAIAGYTLFNVGAILGHLWMGGSVAQSAATGPVIGTVAFSVIISSVCGYLASVIGASRRSGYAFAAMILLVPLTILAVVGIFFFIASPRTALDLRRIHTSGRGTAGLNSIFLEPLAAYLGAMLYRNDA